MHGRAVHHARTPQPALRLGGAPHPPGARGRPHHRPVQPEYSSLALLNPHTSIMVHAIATARALKSSLLAAAGGKRPETRPNTMYSRRPLRVRDLWNDTSSGGGLSFAYSLLLHSFHTRWDRVVPLPPCSLYGAVVRRAPLAPLGPGRALTNDALRLESRRGGRRPGPAYGRHRAQHPTPRQPHARARLRHSVSLWPDQPRCRLLACAARTLNAKGNPGAKLSLR